jgi:hypothetical protein
MATCMSIHGINGNCHLVENMRLSSFHFHLTSPTPKMGSNVNINFFQINRSCESLEFLQLDDGIFNSPNPKPFGLIGGKCIKYLRYIIIYRQILTKQYIDIGSF